MISILISTYILSFYIAIIKEQRCYILENKCLARTIGKIDLTHTWYRELLFD